MTGGDVPFVSIFMVPPESRDALAIAEAIKDLLHTSRVPLAGTGDHTIKLVTVIEPTEQTEGIFGDDVPFGQVAAFALVMPHRKGRTR